jgi:hypothetical protein
MKFRRNGSILGLSLEPDEVKICGLRRTGKGIEAGTPVNVPLAALAFRSDPVNTGVVLRHHLKAAGLAPQRCVVCIPLTWAFTSVVDLPELSEADLQGFIAMEAERRFPLPANELQLTVVYPHVEQGVRRALLLGVPTQYVTSVEAALKAAKLRPVAITLAASALADDASATDGVLLQIGKGFVDLAVIGEGGLLALRNLIWSEGSSETVNPPDVREIARQLRISLAQAPPERRALLKTAILYGGTDWTPALRVALSEAFTTQGMTLSEGSASSVLSPPQTSSALLAAGARALQGAAFSVNVLPKRKSRLHASTRFTPKNIRRVAIVAVAALALLVGAYWWQGERLASLQSTWTAIGPRVDSVKALQDRVRKYRTWYDDAIPSLSIPKCLATAFPEDGTVWVKSLNVKDGVNVTCTGSARSRSEWMQVMDKLGKSGELDNLQVVQTRGDTPFGFTMTFRWKRRE